MRQLISGGIVGLIALFTFNTDSTEFASHKNDKVLPIKVMSTQQLIEQTDLYYKVKSIERELDSIEGYEVIR